MPQRCDRCPAEASVFIRDEEQGLISLCYCCSIGEAEEREAEEDDASLLGTAVPGDARRPTVHAERKGRYCGPCDEWVSGRHRECPKCGADTDKPETVRRDRERDEDDGRTYADPRDERAERRSR